jgi:hypothetical protein
MNTLSHSREDWPGNYSPCLLRFFARLQTAGIKPVEWGTGLSHSMGAPVVVLVRSSI